MKQLWTADRRNQICNETKSESVSGIPPTKTEDFIWIYWIRRRSL